MHVPAHMPTRMPTRMPTQTSVRTVGGDAHAVGRGLGGSEGPAAAAGRLVTDVVDDLPQFFLNLATLKFVVGPDML